MASAGAGSDGLDPAPATQVLPARQRRATPARIRRSQLPSLPSATAAATARQPRPQPACQRQPAPRDGHDTNVRVVTDVLDLDMSLQGGDLLRADLLKYPQDKKPGSPAVRLLTTDEATFSVVRSGLRAADGRPEPTHLATFTTPRTEYRLEPGARELRVPLTWTDGQGVTVMKTYVFRPGKYAVDVLYDVQNASNSDWKAASYVQFVRHVYPQKRSMFDVESYAYRGPAVYDGKAPAEARRRRRRRCQVHATGRRRLDGRDAAPFRLGRRAAGRRAIRIHAAQGRRSFAGQLSRTGKKREPGRFGQLQGKAVRRAETAGPAEARRAETRAHGRLRQADDPVRAAVLAHAEGAQVRRQLGSHDHHRDVSC